MGRQNGARCKICKHNVEGKWKQNTVHLGKEEKGYSGLDSDTMTFRCS